MNSFSEVQRNTRPSELKSAMLPQSTTRDTSEPSVSENVRCAASAGMQNDSGTTQSSPECSAPPLERGSASVSSISFLSPKLQTTGVECKEAPSDSDENGYGDDDNIPLASLHSILSPEDKRRHRESQKAEKEAEKEFRKRLKDQEAELLKMEGDGRRLLAESEKVSRRILRELEREARKAEREVEKESRKKAREAEVEARKMELEALKTEREAASSLSAFGFFSSTTRADHSRNNKLFTSFVQDKRIVPESLRFWEKPEPRANEKDACSPKTRGTGNGLVNPSCFSIAEATCNVESEVAFHSHATDEETSLLHPPIFLESSQQSRATPVYLRDFNAMIEASNEKGGGVHDLLQQCGCSFHTAVSKPYASFDTEVIFNGFYAIGYDPCQSRPPYFGTYNHLLEGNLNKRELLQMGRFDLGGGIPRLTNVDYEYESGDDWDVMEGDEDIAASSSGDSEDGSEANSLDSSDLDFINDDDDGDDSDCDIQRGIMEARQRRLHRLRGKDKLVPSYSGPFVGIPSEEHPLRRFDQLERVVPLDGAYFTALLESELAAFDNRSSALLPATLSEELAPEELEAKRQTALMEAALKNRREMTDVELQAMHTFIGVNSKVSTKTVVKTLLQQQLCVGVARAEMERTVKRFYERCHGMLVRRSEPWLPTDDRLFLRSTSAVSKRSESGPGDGEAQCARPISLNHGPEPEVDRDACLQWRYSNADDDAMKGNPDKEGSERRNGRDEEKHRTSVPRGEEARHLFLSSCGGFSDEKAASVVTADLVAATPVLSKSSGGDGGRSKRQRESESTEDQDGGVVSHVTNSQASRC